VLAKPAESTLLEGSVSLQKYRETPGSVIIDVRTPEEFTAGRLEEAVNIDIQDSSFQSKIGELDPTKTYFIYCGSGKRSAQARSIMESKGFGKVCELQGGISSMKGE